MVIGNDDAKFGYHFQLFTIYCHLKDSTSGVSLEIFTYQRKNVSVNFYLDLHFQSHLLQELDVGHIAISLVKDAMIIG